jgi:uncharacterized repeat protein (TIGR03837 family)
MQLPASDGSVRTKALLDQPGVPDSRNLGRRMPRLGIASPFPATDQIFFFPGFSVKSGGLLRETNLLRNHEHWLAANPARNGLEISLFCYDTAPVGALLSALSLSETEVTCHVPHGKPLVAVSNYLGGCGPWQLGNALIQPVPFMAMDDYDQLLWRCDINFVRGEDSFIRAQWAGKPFVWQIYPQDDDAHLVKLEAFLNRYCQCMESADKLAIRRLFLAWNTGKSVESAWLNFMERRNSLANYTADWARHLASMPDMATALVNFCARKV